MNGRRKGGVAKSVTDSVTVWRRKSWERMSVGVRCCPLLAAALAPSFRHSASTFVWGWLSPFRIAGMSFEYATVTKGAPSVHAGLDRF